MFLSKQEMIELTNKHRLDAQRTALIVMGIQHIVRPDGSLLVLRSHVERVLGAFPTNASDKKEKEPNWSALSHA